jgi:hypothetical protein
MLVHMWRRVELRCFLAALNLFLTALIADAAETESVTR